MSEAGSLTGKRAFVFPGQGVAASAGFSSEIRDALREAVGDWEVPYQLSVFAGSIEVLHSLLDRGVEPDVVAGHSLGEYAAAYAAGCLSLEDGVRLVAARDRLMSEASASIPGSMVAVIGADPREVVEAAASVQGIVVAANFNTPRQTVLSGEAGAVKQAAEMLSGRKVALRVAGGFHSPLMQGASDAMADLLGEVALEAPTVPMISGIDGGTLVTAEDVRLALRMQMLSPVRWVAVVKRFAEMGVEEVIEVGEGSTLIKLLKDFTDLPFKGRMAGEVIR